MTKRELLLELKRLLAEKGLYSIDGINSNSNKAELKNAIECLQCSDEELGLRLEKLKQVYPNIYNLITSNGKDKESFKYHSFNRLYVYNNAN